MRFIIEFLFKSRNFLIVYGALLLFVIPGLLSGDYSFENLEIDDSVVGNDSDSHLTAVEIINKLKVYSYGEDTYDKYPLYVQSKNLCPGNNYYSYICDYSKISHLSFWKSLEIIATNSFQGKDVMSCADIHYIMERSQDIALSLGSGTRSSAKNKRKSKSKSTSTTNSFPVTTTSPPKRIPNNANELKVLTSAGKEFHQLPTPIKDHLLKEVRGFYNDPNAFLRNQLRFEQITKITKFRLSHNTIEYRVYGVIVNGEFVIIRAFQKGKLRMAKEETVTLKRRMGLAKSQFGK